MANTSTIQQRPNGQITLNIPRAIAHALGYQKGDTVEFQISQEKIILHKRQQPRPREQTTNNPAPTTQTQSPEDEMMDFGQYTEEEVVARLGSMCDKGDPKGRLCERCGNKTKTGKIFGMIVCKLCWDKQIHPERYKTAA